MNNEPENHPNQPSTPPAAKPVPPLMTAPVLPPVAVETASTEAVEAPQPITHSVAAIEAILRQPARVVRVLQQGGAGRVTLGLLVVAVFFSLVYGLVMGTFSGGVQYWAAPLKVAGGLVASAFICLPSLYIFSCLSGSPARLAEVAGLLSGLLALMTLLLAGFAPVAWVFSQTTHSVAMMGFLHLVFWAVACAFAVGFLFKGFRLIGGQPARGVGVWVVIFLLVMLQMTTALRPLVGESDEVLPSEKRFFLKHWVECLE